MVGTLTYGRDTIRYEVRFLASRQTLAIEVHPDSRVLVRAPVDCPEAVIAERVQKRAGWISRQLAEFDSYRPRTPARQYVNGESHLYLGRQYRLKLVPGDAASVKLTRGQLLVTLPGKPEAERVRALLRRWYLDRARAGELFFHAGDRYSWQDAAIRCDHALAILTRRHFLVDVERVQIRRIGDRRRAAAQRRFKHFVEV